MKKNSAPYFACIVCIVLALTGTTYAASEEGEDGFTGFVVVQTTTNDALLRKGPTKASEAVAKMPAGIMLLVEAWVVVDPADGTSWYPVAEVADDTIPNIRGERTRYLRRPLYINESFVKEIEESVPPITPVVGYDDLAGSPPASQRRMVEQQSVKSFSLPGNKAVVAYTEAFLDSAPLLDKLSSDAYNECDLVAIADLNPGWLLIVDRAGHFDTGWVETARVQIENHSDGREAAYLVALNLGANVPEIMRRWGPGRIVGRAAEKLWYGFSATTELDFEGLWVTYRSQNDFSFKLWRKGAGIGGVFIGEDWCNKDYIQKNFGKLFTIKKSTNDDATENWFFGGSLGGWGVKFHLTFDTKGLVEEFQFSCAPVESE